MKLPVPVGEKGGGWPMRSTELMLVGLATLFVSPSASLRPCTWPNIQRSFGPGRALCRRIVERGAVHRHRHLQKWSQADGSFFRLGRAFALGVMMIPIVMRASEEAKLVPQAIRNASYALA